MRISKRFILPIFFVYFLIFTGHSQTKIDFQPTGKETFFHVIPYDDGGFSLHSMEFSSNGVFRTYDEEGGKQIEKPLPSLISSQRISISKKEGYEALLAVSPYITDDKSKVTFVFGYEIKNMGFHVRIMDNKGEISQIDLPNSYKISAIDMNIKGYLVDEFGNLSVLFSTNKLTSKNKVALVNIDIKQKLSTLIELDAGNITENFELAAQIGTKNNELVFLKKSIENSAESELIFINSSGKIRKSKIRMPDILDGGSYISQEIPQIGEKDNNFYFSLRSNLTLHFFIFKISDEDEMTYTEWTPSAETFPNLKKTIETRNINRPTLIPFLTLYKNGSKSNLIYTYEGRDLVLIDFNFESFEALEEEAYFPNVNAPSTLDLMVYVEQPPFFKTLKDINNTCNLWNSDCLMNIRTVKNSDGTYGYLLISGDKVEKEKYYKNIKIERY